MDGVIPVKGNPEGRKVAHILCFQNIGRCLQGRGILRSHFVGFTI